LRRLSRGLVTLARMRGGDRRSAGRRLNHRQDFVTGWPVSAAQRPNQS
jgi:hypothetical protein